MNGNDQTQGSEDPIYRPMQLGHISASNEIINDPLPLPSILC